MQFTDMGQISLSSADPDQIAVLSWSTLFTVYSSVFFRRIYTALKNKQFHYEDSYDNYFIISGVSVLSIVWYLP